MEGDAYLPSEIARLVLGYLKDSGCHKSYQVFLRESCHLKEYHAQLQRGRVYPTTIAGRKLEEMINEYGSKVIEHQKAQQSQKYLWRRLENVLNQLKRYQSFEDKTSAALCQSSSKPVYPANTSTPLCRDSTIDYDFDLNTNSDEDAGASSPAHSSGPSESGNLMPHLALSSKSRRYRTECSDSGICGSHRSTSSLPTSSPTLESMDVTPIRDSGPLESSVSTRLSSNPATPRINQSSSTSSIRHPSQLLNLASLQSSFKPSSTLSNTALSSCKPPALKVSTTPTPVTVQYNKGRPSKAFILKAKAKDVEEMVGGKVNTNAITVVQLPISGELPAMLGNMNKDLGAKSPLTLYKKGPTHKSSTDATTRTQKPSTLKSPANKIKKSKKTQPICVTDKKKASKIAEDAPADSFDILPHLPDIDTIDDPGPKKAEPVQSATKPCSQSGPSVTEPSTVEDSKPESLIPPSQASESSRPRTRLSVKEQSLLLAASPVFSPPGKNSEADLPSTPEKEAKPEQQAEASINLASMKTPVKNFLSQAQQEVTKNLSPRRKSQAPRRRSTGPDLPSAVTKPRLSPMSLGPLDHTNSNDSFISQGSQGFVPLVEELINNKEFANKLADNINRVKKTSTSRLPDAAVPSSALSSQEEAVTSEGGTQQPTAVDARKRHDSMEIISSEELNQLLKEDDTIYNIIEMTRSDPHIDSLFQMFNVDKNVFIEKEYGISTLPTTPPAPSSTGPLSFSSVLQTTAPVVTDVPMPTSSTDLVQANNSSFVQVVYPSEDGQSHVETVQIVTVSKEDEMAAQAAAAKETNANVSIHEPFPATSIVLVSGNNVVATGTEDASPVQEMLPVTTDAASNLGQTTGVPSLRQDQLIPSGSKEITTDILHTAAGPSFISSSLVPGATPGKSDELTIDVDALTDQELMETGSTKSSPGRRKSSKKSTAPRKSRRKTPMVTINLDEDEEDKSITKKMKKVSLEYVGRHKKCREPWKIDPFASRKKYLGMSVQEASPVHQENTESSASLLMVAMTGESTVEQSSKAAPKKKKATPKSESKAKKREAGKKSKAGPMEMVPEDAPTLDVSGLELCSLNIASPVLAPASKQEIKAKAFLLTSPRVNQAVKGAKPVPRKVPLTTLSVPTKHIRSLNFDGGKTEKKQFVLSQGIPAAKDESPTPDQPLLPEAALDQTSQTSLLSMPDNFDSVLSPAEKANSPSAKKGSATKQKGGKKMSPKQIDSSGEKEMSGKKMGNHPRKRCTSRSSAPRVGGPRTRSQTTTTPEKDEDDAHVESVAPTFHEDTEIAETLISLSTAVVTPKKGFMYIHAPSNETSQFAIVNRVSQCESHDTEDSIPPGVISLAEDDIKASEVLGDKILFGKDTKSASELLNLVDNLPAAENQTRNDKKELHNTSIPKRIDLQAESQSNNNHKSDCSLTAATTVHPGKTNPSHEAKSNEDLNHHEDFEQELPRVYPIDAIAIVEDSQTRLLKKMNQESSGQVTSTADKQPEEILEHDARENTSASQRANDRIETDTRHGNDQIEANTSHQIADVNALEQDLKSPPPAQVRRVMSTTSMVLGSPSGVSVLRVASKPAAMAAQGTGDNASEVSSVHQESPTSSRGSSSVFTEDRISPLPQATHKTPTKAIPTPTMVSPKRSSSLNKLVLQGILSLGLISKSSTKGRSTTDLTPQKLCQLHPADETPQLTSSTPDGTNSVLSTSPRPSTSSKDSTKKSRKRHFGDDSADSSSSSKSSKKKRKKDVSEIGARVNLAGIDIDKFLSKMHK